MDTPALVREIEEVLDGIRPKLHLDGTDVQLVDLGDDDVVKLRLSGQHSKCPIALATLQAGIDEALRLRVPRIRRVVLET